MPSRGFNFPQTSEIWLEKALNADKGQLFRACGVTSHYRNIKTGMSTL